MVQVVLPNDTNPLGTVLGGRVMHWQVTLKIGFTLEGE